MRRIGLGLLAAGACLASAWAQPVEGMYCLRGPGRDVAMLVVRQLQTPHLVFGFTQWSGGRNFAVHGVADARGGGWRRICAPAIPPNAAP